jgi:pyruvate dehydrogenase E1 component alpha subunit
MTGVQVDGNDVLAMYEVTREALERARTGGGPTLIEAMTYRLGDHTTADDATRYRQAEEVEAARKIEPLVRTRALLESQGLWNDAAEQAWKSECSAEVEEAVKAYLATPRQSSDAMFDHLFAELPKNLESQREMARRYAGRH